MEHYKVLDVYTHKKFDRSFYLHKKFGAIKLEQARKRIADELKENENRCAVEILEVLVLNAPKRTKCAENIKTADAHANSQQQLVKSVSSATTANMQRRIKEIKIAPQPPKMQPTLTPTTTTRRKSPVYPVNSNINTKLTGLKQQFIHSPGNTSIVTPISTSLMALSPRMASVAPVAPVMSTTTPNTSAKSTSPFPTPSPIANFNQTPPLSPVYVVPNNYLQPSFQPYYDWYNAQSTAHLTFATPITTPQRQTPMFYTQLLQRQMHAMTQRQNVVGKSQVSAVI